MTIGQQNRSTAVSILKIGISHNAKCAIRDGFCRDSHNYILYMYRFLRDVIFEVFLVNWLSVKFLSSKFHWQNFGLHISQRAGCLVILENKIVKMLDLWHCRNLYASKLCMYMVLQTCMCVCVSVMQWYTSWVYPYITSVVSQYSNIWLMM